ncbi:DUF4276 family protein [Streptomyces sp. cg40]|uniref:DUF4276 family protein n=1 Tax=Streptomyces sp. cg40 TaxID=3419764 RepID=UPI003CFD0019
MRQVHVLVEGATETQVVLRTLQPELAQRGVWLTPVSVKTRRAVGQPHDRGGVSKWSRIEPEIRRLLRNSAVDLVTTMLDFYGLPADTPGWRDMPPSDAYARVQHLESTISKSIDDPRFLPFIALHETEAWVLAAARELAYMVELPRLADSLESQIADAGGAELVNEGPDTAPSKRIKRAYPRYQKVVDGPDAIELLGLPALREACPHLDGWLRVLEGEAG